jgi:hypothetical protein
VSQSDPYGRCVESRGTILTAPRIRPPLREWMGMRMFQEWSPPDRFSSHGPYPWSLSILHFFFTPVLIRIGLCWRTIVVKGKSLLRMANSHG